MSTAIVEVLQVFKGSDGDATRALYARLEQLGPVGTVAVNLFRACKTSERAKVYRGRRYRAASYDTKQWAMRNLAVALDDQAGALGLVWGWGVDSALRDRGDPHFHVLYLDLPTGQVSFHSAGRLDGPDYPGVWDGVRNASADRICRWVGRLLEETARGQ